MGGEFKEAKQAVLLNMPDREQAMDIGMNLLDSRAFDSNDVLVQLTAAQQQPQGLFPHPHTAI